MNRMEVYDLDIPYPGPGLWERNALGNGYIMLSDPYNKNGVYVLDTKSMVSYCLEGSKKSNLELIEVPQKEWCMLISRTIEKPKLKVNLKYFLPESKEWIHIGDFPYTQNHILPHRQIQCGISMCGDYLIIGSMLAKQYWLYHIPSKSTIDIDALNGQNVYIYSFRINNDNLTIVGHEFTNSSDEECTFCLFQIYQQNNKRWENMVFCKAIAKARLQKSIYLDERLFILVLDGEGEHFSLFEYSYAETVFEKVYESPYLQMYGDNEIVLFVDHKNATTPQPGIFGKADNINKTIEYLACKEYEDYWKQGYDIRAVDKEKILLSLNTDDSKKPIDHIILLDRFTKINC